jgi:hypothetical protein
MMKLYHQVSVGELNPFDIPFFLDMFSRDEFLLLSLNLHFACAEGQGK